MTDSLRRDTGGTTARFAGLKTLDAKARTVEVTFSTETPVRRRDYAGAFDEVLSHREGHVRMGRLNSGAPLLVDHEGGTASVVGVVERARIENGKGIATVRFAAEGIDPEADKVFRKVADGVIRNVSVGYRIHKLEKAGGTVEVPVMRATEWEPYEISIVAMGADANAQFRSATTTKGAREMKQTGEELEAVRLERERVHGITTAVRTAKLEAAFGDELIAKGTALDAAREMVLDEMAKREEAAPTRQGDGTNYGRVTGGETSGEKWQRGVENALLQRLNPETIAAAQNKGHLREVDVVSSNAFRGWSLADVARECLENAGVRTRGMSREQVIRTALTTGRRSARGYQGTSDFPILLENTLGKSLLAAYVTQPTTWQRFAAAKDVTDFRAANFYRTGGFGVLDSLNENSEYKNKAIPDGEKKSITVGTKGNIIGITRQMLVNDDLDAMADLTTRLGRAAALTVEKDVYALLALNGGLGPTQSDSQPFFYSASRANVGTAGAISVDSLEADATVMALQKDPSGNEVLNLEPAILLVPRTLLGTAKVLNDAAYDVSTSNKFQVPNRVRGLFRDVVGSPYLTGTRRYLFADPSIAPAIMVAFLEGQGRAPFLDSDEGWRVDGTELKVRLDFAAGMIDPRAAVTNAGA